MIKSPSIDNSDIRPELVTRTLLSDSFFKYMG